VAEIVEVHCAMRAARKGQTQTLAGQTLSKDDNMLDDTGKVQAVTAYDNDE